jgi:hypothetical protein
VWRASGVCAELGGAVVKKGLPGEAEFYFGSRKTDDGKLILGALLFSCHPRALCNVCGIISAGCRPSRGLVGNLRMRQT